MLTVRLITEFVTNAATVEDAIEFAAQSVAMKAVTLENAECVVIDGLGMESKPVAPSFSERVWRIVEGEASDVG